MIIIIIIIHLIIILIKFIILIIAILITIIQIYKTILSNLTILLIRLTTILLKIIIYKIQMILKLTIRAKASNQSNPCIPIWIMQINIIIVTKKKQHMIPLQVLTITNQ
ncbi:hypothetical protein PFFCH_01263 [Plasmodium falciparum FCH/4]|uniref:Transmembrane protein n=1 Tax=Plasmodium falciparum FCH/4 TaxID=1036724 RepID=A0A024VSF7_PLAFA|nr:hypothetical protein PFFCH_01263 [Plasmodium falciparum FCH/4]